MANNGDIGDALRALQLHLRKGLGLAPRPADHTTQAGIATANTLLVTAQAASAAMTRLERKDGQAIGVTDVATRVFTP